MSNEANALCCQNRSGAGQGRAHNQRWWCCLWDNRFEKGGTAAQQLERGMWMCGRALQNRRSWRRCSRQWSWGSLQPVESMGCRAVSLLPSEEEEVTRTMCDELTWQPPFPIPLCCWWGANEEIGSEIEPRKKGRVAMCFNVLFLLILLGFNWQ